MRIYASTNRTDTKFISLYNDKISIIFIYGKGKNTIRTLFIKKTYIDRFIKRITMSSKFYINFYIRYQ